MRSTLIKITTKLTLLVFLSSALVFTFLPAQAHEVQPAIADFTVKDGIFTMDLRVNLEAFIAEIDLDAVEDTNDAVNAGDYDRLRALSGADLSTRAPTVLEKWNAYPLVRIDEKSLALNSVSLVVPDNVNIELTRVTMWRLQGRLDGNPNEVTFHWPAGAGAIVLRQQGVEEPFTGYLDGGQTSAGISIAGGGAQNGWQAFARYIPVGFDHILPKGLDHILFVLGLFLLSTHLRPLIWQVSAFTLAHTVTLAMGALGWVNVPGAIVEPLIAASIVYVAIENIFTSGLSRWRPLVIFGFGLLHGLGFASVLGDFGLPQAQFFPALIGFNIGVEIGQLTVIAIAFALVGWAMKRAWYRRAIAVPASCLIAAVGAYWFVERVFL